MAFSRKWLKEQGIEDEELIEKLIGGHMETVSALKDKLEEAEQTAEELKQVTKERDQLKKDLEKSGETKGKLEELKAEYNKYKADVESKETAAAKTKAVKEYFESKNITGGNLDIALRGCKEEISSIELQDGKIADTKTLDELIRGTFSGLVSTSGTQGASVSKPPVNAASGTRMTKAEIYAKDEKGRYKLSTEERQKAIAETLSTDNNQGGN
ncbi:hypothetical protein [Treponema sp.]|uniref:phage scaffolding protein n=1 Tax=Treponema sp. TaxID=166 RepID=UPI00389110DD